MILETELRTKLAVPIADNTHANFSIRDRLPTLRGVRVLCGFFKSPNRLFSATRRQFESQRGSSEAHGLEKGTPGDGSVRELTDGNYARVRTMRPGFLHEPQRGLALESVKFEVGNAQGH